MKLVGFRLGGSSNGHTAIHDQLAACHEAGIAGSQEGNASSNLFWLRKPANLKTTALVCKPRSISQQNPHTSFSDPSSLRAFV